jgi:hypothetical protein
MRVGGRRRADGPSGSGLPREHGDEAASGSGGLERDAHAVTRTQLAFGGAAHHDGPLVQLDQHQATITVTPHGSTSLVTWDVMTDDNVVDDLNDGYQRVLDSLKATLEASASDRRFVWVLRCPCGTALEGASEDEIVETAFAHLREMHPEMADGYERDHVLFMAQRFVRT